MNKRPAPPSTASAAATIWSGVGEVKTSPGQAASSMPRPTKPACSGSCPEPPPEISATLPGDRGIGAHDVGRRVRDLDETRVGGGEPVQALAQHGVDRVDQLFHDKPPCWLVVQRLVSSAMMRLAVCRMVSSSSRWSRGSPRFGTRIWITWSPSGGGSSAMVWLRIGCAAR